MFKLINFILIIEYMIITENDAQPFYDPVSDRIEVLDVLEFQKNVLHSNRATFIEYYAYWCGYSKKFRIHWKAFSNETILWQKSVLRVAAMDCADEKNLICSLNSINEFPQFKVFSVDINFIMSSSQFEDLIF